MIPQTNGGILEDITIETMPSLNYKMHFEPQRVISKWDRREAMKQVIFKILNTERYKYIIYSWDYGVELEDLFGQPRTYVLPEIERRVTEALCQDDRIESVTDFEFDLSKRGEVLTRFIVHTIYGDIETEKVVNF